MMENVFGLLGGILIVLIKFGGGALLVMIAFYLAALVIVTVLLRVHKLIASAAGRISTWW